jgi:hypothetical protein
MAGSGSVIRIENEQGWKIVHENSAARIYIQFGSSGTNTQVDVKEKSNDDQFQTVYNSKMKDMDIESSKNQQGNDIKLIRLNDGTNWGFIYDKNASRVFLQCGGNGINAKIDIKQKSNDDQFQTVYNGIMKKMEVEFVPQDITDRRDKFQVVQIYPTKQGGQEYYMPENIDKDKWDNDYYHQNINRTRTIGGEKTSSNDMHFKKSIRDVEATGYFKFVDGMDDVDVKLRGGHHSDNGSDSARCYIFRINEQMFGKEFPHDSGNGYSWHKLKGKFEETGREYTEEEKVKFDLDFNSLKGKWIGFKGITINEGQDKVRCEMYIDTEGIDSNGNFDPERQNWRKWYSILDADGLFGEDNSKHKTKKAWTENQVNSTIQFRLDAETGNDDMKLKQSDFKFLSAREITK